MIYVRGDGAAQETPEGTEAGKEEGAGEGKEAAAADDASEARERCVSAAELDEMASSEVEWAWRRGFRRLVPGRATPLQETLRPLTPADELMLAFEVRWPRNEAAWPPDEHVMHAIQDSAEHGEPARKQQQQQQQQPAVDQC